MSNREQIERYLQNECKVKSDVVRETLMNKVMEFDDIGTEFLQWLDTRDYSLAQLKINGYTAQDIHELAPQLEGIGVYNFLVTLRKQPDDAAEIMRSGFIAM